MQDSLTTIFHYLDTQRNKTRFQSRRALEEWQDRKMQSHLAWVKAHSPFYRELWKDYALKDWRFFPTIDKKQMMENFEGLNTQGISAEKAFEVALKAENSRNFSPQINGITVGLSSGTSGHRGLFLCSKKEQNAWAGSMLAKILPGPIWQETRVAFFLRASSNLYESIEKGKITFRYFDMLKPIDSHVDALQSLQPSLIIAPPQVLRQIAAQINSKKLRIFPKKIVSVAETLDPLDQKILENCFDQKIHQGYQATEGFLATTCKEGHLHLNEDILVIEKEFLPDSSTKFTPILSDFRRKTQPIIRYRLNDVLEIDPNPCKCGSVFQRLKAIHGRMDDVFYFEQETSQTRKFREIYPDFIRRSILKTSVPLTDYKVEQSNPEVLQFGFHCSSSTFPSTQVLEEVQANINALAKELNCKAPKISEVPYEPPKKGVKLRRIQRNFQLESYMES